jgi:hypothetical protein
MSGRANMITQTNIKDTLGASLPQIYFNSFTLSNGGDIRRSIQDPHIQHPNETNAADLNEIGDTLKNKSLYVNINLILKETVTQNSSLMFLTGGDILKYIKIGVVQCMSNGAHNSIKKNPNKWFKSGGLIDQGGAQTKHIKRKIISLNETTLGALKTVTAGENIAGQDVSNNISIISELPYARNQDADGNIVFDIGMYTDFVIGPSQGGSEVSFLSYFCYAYFDLNSFVINDGEFGQISLPSEIIDILSVGQVSSELVISQKKVNKTSYVFLDQNNKYWLGNVHQMEDGQWMKGETHLNSQGQTDYLTRLQVPNEKVVDNREVINIEQINLDYTQFSNYISNDAALISLMKNSKTDGLLKKLPKVFSDLYLTRDKSNNARFMFTVNMHELIKQNTVFPALLDFIKETDKQEYLNIVSKAKVYNFKIYRQRVKNQELIKSDIQRTSFSTTDPRILLVNTKDSNGVLNTVTSKKKPKGNFKKNKKKVKNIASLKEIGFLIENNMGLRSFSAIDFDISRQLDGLYEYSAELEVSDPIPNFLRKKVKQLILITDGTKSKKGLKGYLQDAISNPSYYDTHTNRFTLEFYDFYDQRYGASSQGFIANKIVKYVETMLLLSGQSFASNLDSIRLLDYLIKISSPNTGSPDGIQLVIKLIEDFITKLNSLMSSAFSFKKKPTNLPSDAYGETPNLNSGKSTRNFVIEKTFKNLYDASIPKTFGIDYLSIGESELEGNYDGIFAISSKNFEKRVKLETKKYFKGNNVDIAIKDSEEPDATLFNPGDSIQNKKYTFFSPSVVKIPQRKDESILKNGSLNQSYAELNDLVVDIARYNSRMSSIGTLSSDKTEKNNKITPNNQKRRFDLVNLFAEKGCTFRVEKKLPSNAKSPISNTTANTAIGLQNIDEGDNIFESSDLNKPANSENILDSLVNPNNLLSALLQIDDLDFFDDRNTMNFYKVKTNSGPGAGKSFKDDLFAYALLAGLGGGTGGEGQVSDQAPLTRAPNQLKAFMLSLMKSDAVRKIPIFDEATPDKDPKYANLSPIKKKKMIKEGTYSPPPPPKDIMRNPDNFGFIYFNYRNIRKIEVLRSYKMVENEIFVGEPIWTDLQAEDLTSISGAPLVCRHKQHFNAIQGSLMPKDLEMPSYNEYFILTRDSQVVDVATSGISQEGTFSNGSVFQAGSTTPTILTEKQDYGEPQGLAAARFSDFKLQRDKYLEQRVLNFEPPKQGGTRGIVRTEYLKSELVSKQNTIEDAGVRVDRKGVLAEAAKFDSLSKSEKQNMLKELGLDQRDQQARTATATSQQAIGSPQGSVSTNNTTTTSTTTGGSRY